MDCVRNAWAGNELDDIRPCEESAFLTHSVYGHRKYSSHHLTCYVDKPAIQHGAESLRKHVGEGNKGKNRCNGRVI